MDYKENIVTNDGEMETKFKGKMELLNDKKKYQPILIDRSTSWDHLTKVLLYNDQWTIKKI